MIAGSPRVHGKLSEEGADKIAGEIQKLQVWDWRRPRPWECFRLPGKPTLFTDDRNFTIFCWESRIVRCTFIRFRRWHCECEGWSTGAELGVAAMSKGRCLRPLTSQTKHWLRARVDGDVCGNSPVAAAQITQHHTTWLLIPLLSRSAKTLDVYNKLAQ